MIDLLKIGVEIQLTNLISNELRKIVTDMIGLDKATKNTIKTMGGFKTMVVGLGMVGFGAGILAGMYKISKEGAS